MRADLVHKQVLERVRAGGAYVAQILVFQTFFGYGLACVGFIASLIAAKALPDLGKYPFAKIWASSVALVKMPKNNGFAKSLPPGPLGSGLVGYQL